MATKIYDELKLDDPKEEIRLVKLQPCRDGEGLLEACMYKARLSDDPEYEALSYVWGDNTLGRVIQITPFNIENRATSRFPPPLDFQPASHHQSGLTSHSLPVTDNLDLALRRLRQATEERVSWIDAICMNQSNHDERACQVSIMGRIFKQATNVLGWLGRPAEGIDERVVLKLPIDEMRALGRYGHSREWCSNLDDFFRHSLKAVELSALADMAAKAHW